MAPKPNKKQRKHNAIGVRGHLCDALGIQVQLGVSPRRKGHSRQKWRKENEKQRTKRRCRPNPTLSVYVGALGERHGVHRRVPSFPGDSVALTIVLILLVSLPRAQGSPGFPLSRF